MLAFSRVDGQPRACVPGRIRERARDGAKLLRGDTCAYICGLQGMEAGVLDGLEEVCPPSGLRGPSRHERRVGEGRFHVETS